MWSNLQHTTYLIHSNIGNTEEKQTLKNSTDPILVGFVKNDNFYEKTVRI